MDAASPPDDASRLILRLLYEGLSTDEILAQHPHLRPPDLARAAGAGLAALESREAPRIETREERIARLRVTHPRAYAPWTPDEDAHLLRLAEEGWSARRLAEALGRPRGAIARRLEKWAHDPEGAQRILAAPQEDAG